jgi:hypothetical protein
LDDSGDNDNSDSKSLKAISHPIIPRRKLISKIPTFKDFKDLRFKK